MNVRQFHPTDDTSTVPAVPRAGAHDRATVTVTEAADVLGISRSTAYELVHTGAIPALRLGRRIVIPTHALDQLLHSTRPTN
jgi:excisionase family DNA binding protein